MMVQCVLFVPAMVEQVPSVQVPWFKDRTAPPPFSLTTNIRVRVLQFAQHTL